MQPWHRWREPLAVALSVALALMLVLRVTSLVLAVAAGTPGGLHGTLPGGDDLLLLATAAAVLWCTTPLADAEPREEPVAMSPHAWPVAVTGLVVVGLTVLGRLLLSLDNLAALISRPTPDTGLVLLVIEGLLRLALPAAALGAVVLAVRRAAAARRTEKTEKTVAALPDAEPEATAVTAAPERLPAAWQADEATGAVWLTADDAAQGQPGLSWSDPTATAGAVASGPWAPAPPPATPSAPPPAPPPVGETVVPTTAAEDDDLR